MAMLLILITWGGWIIATFGIGLALVKGLARRRKLSPRSQAQAAIWLGTFCLVSLSVILNFFVPMAGAVAQGIALTWIVVGLALSAFWLVSMRASIRGALRRTIHPNNFIAVFVLGLLGISALLSAWFAVAEPMDYDAGLYRMGLINYAAEYPVIPGLANLHDRFGFGSALGPVSALLGNGIWESSNFRVVTGFFIVLLLVDVVLRIAVPRQRTAGDFLIVLGWGFVAWVVLSDSGRWVPSPGQDLIALITGIVALAFLLDYVDARSRAPWKASTALLAAGVSAAIRPLAGLLVLLVVVVMIVAPRVTPAIASRNVSFKSAALTFAAVSFLGLAMIARDVVISGWVLFPLSSFPVDVDWLANDPRGASLGITWWGRAPGVSIEEAESAGWFGPWLERFLQSREVQFLQVTILFIFATLLWKSGRRAWKQVWRPAIVVTLPIAVMIAVWFITAPDVRFGWTPLFGFLGAPLALLLAHGAYPQFVYRSVFFIFLAAGVLSDWRAERFEQRGNPLQAHIVDIFGREVTLMLGPPNEVVTVPGKLADGTSVVFPRDGENCYMEFPLCLLPGTGAKVEKRGETIAEGFRIIR